MMRPSRAIVLGAVQGPTELLPVSSSAHLTLIPWLAGWDARTTRPRAAEELRGRPARRRRGRAADRPAAGDRRGAPLLRPPQGRGARPLVPAPGALRRRLRAPDRAPPRRPAADRGRPAGRGGGDGRSPTGRHSAATGGAATPLDGLALGLAQAAALAPGRLAQRRHPDRCPLARLHPPAREHALPHRRAAGDRRRSGAQGRAAAAARPAARPRRRLRRRDGDLVRLDARLAGADPAGRARQRALALRRLPGRARGGARGLWRRSRGRGRRSTGQPDGVAHRRRQPAPRRATALPTGRRARRSPERSPRERGRLRARRA